jgi:hypothetical protein
MSYTYASFQKALALEMIIPNANVSDPNFVAILPTIVDYAEQRIYRELDLLHTQVMQWFAMTPGQRAQSFAASGSVFANPTPAQQILVVGRVRVIPATATPGGANQGGEPLSPSSMDYIDAVYSGLFPNPGPVGRPVTFALHDDQTIVFGPAPDQSYFFNISGEARPVPLYSAAPGDGTQTTFLTSVLPDLFLAAAMISASGYRHNFGAQADDPRMAVSWENQYMELLVSAKTEETRKRFLGWNMMSSHSMPPQTAAPAPAG